MKLLFLLLALGAVLYVAYVAVGGAAGGGAGATAGPAASMENARDAAGEIEKKLQDHDRRIDDTGR